MCSEAFCRLPLSVMGVGACVYVLSKLACVCWFEASQNVNQTEQSGMIGVKSGCGWFLCMVGKRFEFVQSSQTVVRIKKLNDKRAFGGCLGTRRR